MSRRKKAKGREKAARPGLGLHRTAAILIAVVLLVGAIGGGILFAGRGGGEAPPSGPPTAAIVDQLSLTAPNPALAKSATDTLEDAGYTVDYYPGEQVTVNFYRNLPTQDYDLIVFRVHAAMVNGLTPEGEKFPLEYVSLFTGEPFDESKYPDDRQLVDGICCPLASAVYYEGGDPLFSVGPDFFEHSANGRFDDTLILMMGCNGLTTDRMAEAFLNKGARAFVSWTDFVTASHTDAATQELLDKLLLEGLPTADAVSQTAAEVGPDPAYGAELRFVEG